MDREPDRDPRAPHRGRGREHLPRWRRRPGRAIERAKLAPQDVHLIIVGTCTPDYLFPATGALVQSELGATRAGAFDVEAACTSFVYAR